MNLSEFVKVKDYNFILPAELKVCEGCKYFDALIDGEAHCYLFGRLKSVQMCMRKDDARRSEYK